MAITKSLGRIAAETIIHFGIPTICVTASAIAISAANKLIDTTVDIKLGAKQRYMLEYGGIKGRMDAENYNVIDLDQLGISKETLLKALKKNLGEE